jgi:DNA ligase 1
VFIDCELWYYYNPSPFLLYVLIHSFRSGRGKYTEVMRMTEFEEMRSWSWLRIMAFDCPDQNLHMETYEDRYKLLYHGIVSGHPVLVLSPSIKCEDKNHSSKFAEDIWNHGGEGSIIRKENCLYEKGRSSSVLKIKGIIWSYS